MSWAKVRVRREVASEKMVSWNFIVAGRTFNFGVGSKMEVRGWSGRE